MSENRVHVPVSCRLGTHSSARDVRSAFTLPPAMRGEDAFLQIAAWGARPDVIRKARWLLEVACQGTLSKTLSFVTVAMQSCRRTHRGGEHEHRKAKKAFATVARVSRLFLTLPLGA